MFPRSFVSLRPLAGRGSYMLLKCLGEQGERALNVVERAVAVSAPVDLRMVAKQLDYGWNR